MGLAGKVDMRQLIRTMVIVCPLGFTPFLSAALPHGPAVAVTRVGACERHLATLVSSLQKLARREDRALSIESRANGTMLLHYEDFTQRIRCRDGVLRIDIE
jgi:hypothetical protein